VSRVTDLALSAADPARLDVDALVVAVADRDGSPALLDDGALPPALASRLVAALSPLGVRGAVDEVVRIPAGDDVTADLMVLTGVGSTAHGGMGAETLRRAAGAAIRALDGAHSAALLLPAETVEEVAAVAEGALLGAYRVARYRTDGPHPVTEITVVTDLARDRGARAAVRRAEVLARAVHGTRDLVNASPAEIFPASFADVAVEAAKGTKVKVTVLDETALRDGGFGGLVGVGQGSTRPPRLVKVSYTPARAHTHVALVGKGITFDSGGLSIKPAKAMETMKCDMAGAAAVLHTVLAAAALEIGVRVTGWLALAENMPSGSAQRPSDVITIRGGTTVEVLNTDAEGRLVLADALVAAVEESPDVVVDVATLTGAQMIALGNRVSAVMGTEAVREEVVDAAREAGEAFWPMPLPDELEASLKSPVADIANMGEKHGGMLVAGVFLRRFAGSVPWAHLDIAGPAFNEGQPFGYTPRGGTGVSVRTLVEFLERRATGPRA
jgi:leucyl aminopeptidase